MVKYVCNKLWVVPTLYTCAVLVSKTIFSDIPFCGCQQSSSGPTWSGCRPGFKITCAMYSRACITTNQNLTKRGKGPTKRGKGSRAGRAYL